jgi:hypothetical protein
LLGFECARKGFYARNWLPIWLYWSGEMFKKWDQLGYVLGEPPLEGINGGLLDWISPREHGLV